MKDKVRGERSGSVKYVKLMGRLFLCWSIVLLPTLMIFLVLAFNTKGTECVLYSIGSALLALAFFVSYGFYTFRVTLGTVIGLEQTDKVVHLHTKRKTFTYDAHMGCVEVKVKRNRYVCVFETQDSRDSFLFYRHAPFSKYSDGQYTDRDIAGFCPAFDGEDGKSIQ